MNKNCFFCSFLIIVLVSLISFSQCTHQIWTTGNPYQLGVSLLTNFFNYGFSPIQVTNPFKPEIPDNYTQISVSAQKVVALSSRGRLLMWGSNQNYVQSDNPATVIDAPVQNDEETIGFKITLDEPVVRVVSMVAYAIVIGKTKIQYFANKKSYIVDIPAECQDFVFLPTKGVHGYLWLASGNTLCAIFKNGFDSYIPVAETMEATVNVTKIDTSLWLPKDSNIIHISSRRGSFLILTDKFEVFTFGTESLSGNAYINEWTSLLGMKVDYQSVETSFPLFAKGFKGKLPIDIIGGVDGVIVRFLNTPKNKNILYSYYKDIIELPEDPNFLQMEVGDKHVVFLKREDNGKNGVYVVGTNDFGELGVGNKISIGYVTPQKMKIDFFNTSSPTYIAADCHFSLVMEDFYPNLPKCNGKYFTEMGICSGHGKCTEKNQCMCFSGFYGNDCEKVYSCFGQTNLNSDTICSGQGLCVAEDKCSCYPGYFGEKCENYTCFGIPSNDPSVCSGAGTCSSPDKCDCNNPEIGEIMGAECHLKKSTVPDEVYFYSNSKLTAANVAKFFWKGESIKKVIGDDNHLHILTTEKRLFFWGKDVDFNSGFGVKNFVSTNCAFEVPFFKQLRKLKNETVYDISTSQNGGRFTVITTGIGVYYTGVFPDRPYGGFKFPSYRLNCTDCIPKSNDNMNYLLLNNGTALKGFGDVTRNRIGDFDIELKNLLNKNKDNQVVSLGTSFINGCSMMRSFVGLTDTGIIYGQLNLDIRISKPSQISTKSNFFARDIPNLLKAAPLILESNPLYKTVANTYSDFVAQTVDAGFSDPIIGEVVDMECGENYGAFKTLNGSWYAFGGNVGKALATTLTAETFCWVSSWVAPLNRFGGENNIKRPAFGNYHALYMLNDGRIVAAGLHKFSFPGTCNELGCEIPIKSDIKAQYPNRKNEISAILATQTNSYFITSSMKEPLTCDGAPQNSSVPCSGRGKCNEFGKCSCPELTELRKNIPLGLSLEDVESLGLLPQNGHCQVNERSTILIIQTGTGVTIFSAIATPILLICCFALCIACCCCMILIVGGPLLTLLGLGVNCCCTILCKKHIIKKFQDKQTYELTQALLKTNPFEDPDGTDGDASEVDSAFSIDKSLFSINYDDLKDLKELDEQGGSGCLVFKASWKGETVFVKLFKITAGSDSGKYDLSEFKREVQLMASMNHSSIVSFFGMFFASPKRVGYVTEFCTHGNLYSIIGLNTPMKKKLTYLIQIAKGMRYLHEKGVIFRDLKCQNVLLDENFNVKLTDFGISRLAKAGKQSGTYTKSVGTSQYMAPEIVRGEKYNEKVDVYSYSILMYEIYYDTKKPFGDDAPFNVEFKVAQEKTFRPKLLENPPENSGQCSKVHNSINELMQKCWDDDPESRPSFGEIIEKLSMIFVDYSC